MFELQIYSHYQTKDLAMSIGKNAGAMALQVAAVTTGLKIVGKISKSEKSVLMSWLKVH